MKKVLKMQCFADVKREFLQFLFGVCHTSAVYFPPLNKLLLFLIKLGKGLI